MWTDPPLRGGGRRPLRPRPDARHDAPVDRPGGLARPGPAWRCARTTLITSTHRGHGHCIAKGADLVPDDGRAARQGDRLLPRPRRLDAHRRRRHRQPRRQRHRRPAASRSPPAPRWPTSCAATDRVVACFFGDGATNEGAFHEAVNLAAIWKLPVVFVCENNKYGMSLLHREVASRSTTSPSAPPPTASRACTVDGNDVDGGLRRRRATAVDAGPRRRGPDAGRVRDLPLEGPQQERQEPLPHHARRSPSGGPTTRSRDFEAEVDASPALLDREPTSSRPRRRRWRRMRAAVRAGQRRARRRPGRPARRRLRPRLSDPPVRPSRDDRRDRATDDATA